jgi:hypothetical protein
MGNRVIDKDAPYVGCLRINGSKRHLILPGQLRTLCGNDPSPGIPGPDLPRCCLCDRFKRSIEERAKRGPDLSRTISKGPGARLTGLNDDL